MQTNYNECRILYMNSVISSLWLTITIQKLITVKFNLGIIEDLYLQFEVFLTIEASCLPNNLPSKKKKIKDRITLELFTQRCHDAHLHLILIDSSPPKIFRHSLVPFLPYRL